MKIYFPVFALFITAIASAQNFEVTAVAPVQNSMKAERDSEIRIGFNKPVDPLSLNDTTFMVFGRWSGVIKGSFTFSTDTTQLIFTPTRFFFYGETVNVSLSHNLLSKNGDHLIDGFTWQFWVKTAPGSFNLVETDRISTRLPGEGWIQTYGTYAGDINSDGYSDFLVPNEISNDVRVFLNNKSGGYQNFTVFPIPGGSRPSPNEGADFDLDGNIDFAVGNSSGDQLTVFINDGTGSFNSVTNFTAGLSVRGVTVADINTDGFTDIITSNRTASNISLLLNNGNGTFSNSGNIETGADGETACSAVDVNSDGISDLFVGALNSGEILLMLGDGQGNFNIHSTIRVNGDPWMIATGDVNGDGTADVVSANSNGNNFSVVFTDSIGNLIYAEDYPCGSFPLAIDLGDIDGDGDLDVVTSNFGTADFTIYENDGTGIFINPFSLPAVSAGSCAVLHDRDNDGDLDMTGIDEIEDLLILFDNNPPATTEDDTRLAGFFLDQNYPNPFNPSTTIRYVMNENADVSLIIYNSLGEEVAVLVNSFHTRGIYSISWNGRDNRGIVLPSGLYLYRIVAGDFVEVRKMILNK